MLEIPTDGEVVVYEQSNEVLGLGRVTFVTAFRSDSFRSGIVAESHVFICADATHIHEFQSLSFSEEHGLGEAGKIVLRNTHRLLAAYLRKRSTMAGRGAADVAYATKILPEPPFSRFRAEGMFQSELSGILDWTQFTSIRTALAEGLYR